MPTWVQLATPARPTWVGVAALAFAMLPRWARRMYGLPGLPVSDAAASVVGRGVRRSLLSLPPRLRHGPHYRAAVARLLADPPPLRRLAPLPAEHDSAIR
jgi:uncharacterized protein (DUF2236 family)